MIIKKLIYWTGVGLVNIVFLLFTIENKIQQRRWEKDNKIWREQTQSYIRDMNRDVAEKLKAKKKKVKTTEEFIDVKDAY